MVKIYSMVDWLCDDDTHIDDCSSGTFKFQGGKSAHFYDFANNRTLVGEAYEDLVFKKWWPGSCSDGTDKNKLECDDAGDYTYGMSGMEIEDKNLSFGTYRVKKDSQEIIFEVDSDCNETILKEDDNDGDSYGDWNWRIKCSVGQHYAYPQFIPGPGHTCTCWAFGGE